MSCLSKKKTYLSPVSYDYVQQLTYIYCFSLNRQDDVESFSMTTSRQGSSMLDVEGLVKARSLQVLFAGSKVAVKASKSSGIQIWFI